ncbi:HelD family protein [Nocardioides speluncae]|uniref:HelD family protein n=1 Tax=Nocardioides speluncae TaxID=2670337 RepID=UPI000D6987D9|nr:ATP-binding domain-containing protein [Nocardioides speluncae]
MPDPELTHEQGHLAASRQALARMRAKTESMDASAAGDWVSRQFLESAIYRRMKALEDDPTVPLFFGRLDYAAGEDFYVGRRHVTDELGDPMVVDWRAPISLPFYRAQAKAPMGVARRRRFGFQTGMLTAYEDERLDRPRDEEYSRILEEEIERPRVGPMRDIVATIQPEQDVIVRADLTESVLVQGAPGTGKTAVGLHRAAYLLYTHRDQLTRQGVLVVGPNASFLRYIGDVLPALGEIDARHSTIEDLVAERAPIRGTDDPAVATLKGDARMAEVLSRAIWGSVRQPNEPLVVPRGSARWRVPAYEIEEILASQKSRGVRYGAARAMLAQRFAHAVLVKMELAGNSPDDRVQDAVARSRPVKAAVDEVWPRVLPARIVKQLLTEPDFLATAADGVLSPEEQALLLRDRPKRSLADAVLVDEAADLVERTPSLGHVVADEAQDLSPMMLRAVGRRCSTGSATVLGDLAQATTPWGARSWEAALGHLGLRHPGRAAHIEELTQGFRVPGAVIEYAARLLPVIAPELRPPTSLRRTRGELRFETGLDLTGALAEERIGSVGVIAPDALVPRFTRWLEGRQIAHQVLGVDEPALDKQVDLVPASLAKGLEFDHVVLVEPADIVDQEADRMTGLRRLYVCLTRAVTSLVVLHERELPPELGAS